MINAVTELIQKTADEIKQQSIGFENGVLPSTRELSNSLQVSRVTILKTIDYLAQSGFLIKKANGRYALANYKKKNPEPKPQDMLHKHVKNQVLNGLLRIGERLPKRAKYGLKFGLTINSVGTVFKQLENEGIICRQGRYYFVAGNEERVKFTNPHSGKYIAVFGAHGASWRSGVRSNWCKKFFINFKEILESYGYELILFSHSNSKILFEKWKKKSKQHLKKYSGSLIIGETKKDIWEPHTLAKSLARYKEPVIWFDKSDENWPMASNQLPITRFSIKHLEFVSAGIKYIHQLGHLNTTFYLSEDIEWQQDRLKILRQIAKTLSPSMEIRCIKRPLSDWQNPISSGLAKRLEQLKFTPYQKQISLSQQYFRETNAKLMKGFSEFCPKEARDLPNASLFAFFNWYEQNHTQPKNLMDEIHHSHFLYACDGLAPFMQEENRSTLLISPNDTFAHQHLYYWARILKLKIPQDFSVLSFDNYSDDIQRPVTSVDNSFSVLGKAAATHISGTGKPFRDKKGSYFTSPFVVDRGTVMDLRLDAKQLRKVSINKWG